MAKYLAFSDGVGWVGKFFSSLIMFGFNWDWGGAGGRGAGGQGGRGGQGLRGQGKETKFHYKTFKALSTATATFHTTRLPV